MKNLITCSLALAVTAAAFAQPTAKIRYSITDLGVMPGMAASSAEGLNERGEVVGHCAPPNENFNQQGFVWSNGTMRSIGLLDQGEYSLAHAINESGSVVGEGDEGFVQPQAILSSGNSLLNIEHHGGSNLRAIAITDSGVIIGNRSISYLWAPIVWTQDPAHTDRFLSVLLPNHPSGQVDARMGYAFGANNSAQVVGYVQSTVFGQLGALWANDAAHTLTLLQPAAPGWTSYAYDINDVGQSVGDSLAGSATIPTVWNNDASHTPTALPWLPGGSQASALAINRQGMVIGWSNTGAAPNVRRPVLWMNGRAIDITQTLDASGFGWSEIYVSGLNDRGQIVGTGLHNGQQRAFLLNPVKPTSIRLP